MGGEGGFILFSSSHSDSFLVMFVIKTKKKFNLWRTLKRTIRKGDDIDLNGDVRL